MRWLATAIAIAIVCAGCRQPGKTAIRPEVHAVTTCASGPDPQVTLSCNRNKLAVGEKATFVSQVTCPSTETQPSRGVVWAMQIDRRLAVLKTTGPQRIANQAVLTWSDDAGRQYQAASNTVFVRVSGATLAVQPDANGKLTVEVGDMAPGDSEEITVEAQRIE